MKKFAVAVALLGAGLLFTQFVWLAPVVRSTNDGRFAQKVNLALRRTAHHLLLAVGDSISRIAPVRQLNPTTFIIRLDHPFDYGRLPLLLQQSMAIHGIKDNYDVAVLDCRSGQLQLGYNFLDVTEKNEVPCGGRDQKQGCYNLQIAFASTENRPQSAAVWWPWAVGFLLLGGSYIVWQKSARKPNPAVITDSVIHESSHLIHIGNVSFNPANQSVSIAGNAPSLTYREAKLLHLFLRHPNQLLERDFILKSVWEDEGIIVGRSVDVFVSRLRKLLQPDPTVRIVAVHGVGYRLEVSL
jgi:DNA-binding winged helix-turn-helix (wHTH) protein